MNGWDDMKRRRFAGLGLVGITGLRGRIGTTQNQLEQVDAEDFQPSVFLIGPPEARPPPDDAFFENKPFYQYIYLDTKGIPYLLDHERPDWLTLPHTTARKTKTVPKTVSGTDGKTAVMDETILKPEVRKGISYEADLYGQYTTATANEQFTLTVEINGVSVASITSTAARVDGGPLQVRVVIGIQAAGEVGDVAVFTDATLDNENLDTPDGVATVDLDKQNTARMAIEWAGSDSGNQVTVFTSRLRQMG